MKEEIERKKKAIEYGIQYFYRNRKMRYCQLYVAKNDNRKSKVYFVKNWNNTGFEMLYFDPIETKRAIKL